MSFEKVAESGEQVSVCVGFGYREARLCVLLVLMMFAQSCNAGHLGVDLSLIDELFENGTVELRVEISNHSESTIVFLPWGTAMESPLKSRAFAVIDVLSGEELPYQGRMVKRRVPHESDYVTLGAGQKIVNQLVLSTEYEFCSDRKYTISAQPTFFDQNHKLINTSSSVLAFSTNKNMAVCRNES